MNFEQQHAAYLTACEQAVGQMAAPVWRENSRVSEAARYSLENGGKRVRGVLTLAVCDLLGGNAEAAAAFACAVEMVHAFSLVHDDLPCMDDDDVRRGKPACHIAYGEATALLAGDLLALGAFEVLANAAATAEQRIEAVRVLGAASGARGMIYGQELDLRYETKAADEAALHSIQAHKTGELITAAAHLGAVAAEKPLAEVPAVTQYARNIGLVFQIVDDVLDEEADPALLGKPVGSDAQQGKTTFVTMFGKPEAKRRAAELTQQAADGLRQAYGEKAAFLCAFAQQLARRVY